MVSVPSPNVGTEEEGKTSEDEGGKPEKVIMVRITQRKPAMKVVKEFHRSGSAKTEKRPPQKTTAEGVSIFWAAVIEGERERDRARERARDRERVRVRVRVRESLSLRNWLNLLSRFTELAEPEKQDLTATFSDSARTSPAPEFALSLLCVLDLKQGGFATLALFPVLTLLCLVDVSDIFFFFCLGRGKGESEAKGGGGSIFN